MWGTLKQFLTANAVKLAGAALSVASVAAILLGARQSGKTAERAEALQKQVERVRKSHEIEDNNRKLGDDDVANRLRHEWSRD
jgi:hypothetical protein